MSVSKSENFEDEFESSASSELDVVDQYKELEHIYNKLIVNTGKTNLRLTQQRTLIPGAHARKLGIRLKTAKQLSEKRQDSRPRLKTAEPRLGLSTRERVDVMITPLPTDRSTRSRISTAYTSNQRQQKLSKSLDRKMPKSAPPIRVENSYIKKPPITNTEESTDDSNQNRLPPYSSLAMYSPQTQRFSIEQLALQQTRVLKRLSHIQTHRVDKKFYVSGAPCDIKDRYNIDEEQYSLLMEITNKGKSADPQKAHLSLSKSILQHFSPELNTPGFIGRPLLNQRTRNKRVSLRMNNNSSKVLSNKSASPTQLPDLHVQQKPLQTDRQESKELDSAEERNEQEIQKTGSTCEKNEQPANEQIPSPRDTGHDGGQIVNDDIKDEGVSPPEVVQEICEGKSLTGQDELIAEQVDKDTNNEAGKIFKKWL